MEAVEHVRIDKWLWAVRVFKTRSLATEACRAGNIKIEGHSVKPSREVKLNETITARKAGMTLTLKVLGLAERRLSPKVTPQFVLDQTPAEEYQQRRERRQAGGVYRKKGQGRPTKKDRRALDQLKF